MKNLNLIFFFIIGLQIQCLGFQFNLEGDVIIHEEYHWIEGGQIENRENDTLIVKIKGELTPSLEAEHLKIHVLEQFPYGSTQSMKVEKPMNYVLNKDMEYFEDDYGKPYMRNWSQIHKKLFEYLKFAIIPIKTEQIKRDTSYERTIYDLVTFKNLQKEMSYKMIYSVYPKPKDFMVIKFEGGTNIMLRKDYDKYAVNGKYTLRESDRRIMSLDVKIVGRVLSGLLDFSDDSIQFYKTVNIQFRFDEDEQSIIKEFNAKHEKESKIAAKKRSNTKWFVQPIYKEIQALCFNGKSCFITKNHENLYGLVDSKGKIVLENKYKLLKQEKDDILTGIDQNDKRIITNFKGQIYNESTTSTFFSQETVIKDGSTFKFFNKEGAPKWSIGVPKLFHIANGVFVGYEFDKKRFLFKDGKRLTKSDFIEIEWARDLLDGDPVFLALKDKNDSKLLLNSKGKVLLDNLPSEIYPRDKLGNYLVTGGRKVDQQLYINLKTRKIDSLNCNILEIIEENIIHCINYENGSSVIELPSKKVLSSNEKMLYIRSFLDTRVPSITFVGNAGDEIGAFDLRGNTVVDNIYNNITVRGSNYIIVQKNFKEQPRSRSYIFNLEGKQMLPGAYKSIKVLGDSYLMVHDFVSEYMVDANTGDEINLPDGYIFHDMYKPKEWTGSPLFIIKKQEAYNISNLKGNKLFNYDYDAISVGTIDHAIIKLGQGIGLLKFDEN